jgi:ssRNA-specific RNase YbeY (16S rRNA maturation enzyme)
MKLSGVSGFDISITFTTNKRIKQQNYETRGHNKPTDVLSFPFLQVKDDIVWDYTKRISHFLNRILVLKILPLSTLVLKILGISSYAHSI